MNITEFAAARNVQSQTISIYIKRHKNLFDGHTKKVGKNIELDEVALNILDEKYPLSRPVQLLNGVDPEEHKAVMDELNKAQKTIIGLQSKITDYSLQIAKAEATQILLEDKEKQLEQKEHQLHELENKKQKMYEQYVLEHEKLSRCQDRIEVLKKENDKADKLNAILLFALLTVIGIIAINLIPLF